MTRVIGRSVNHIEHAEWLQWLHYAETIAVHGASLVQQNIIIAEEFRSPLVIKLESRRLEKTLEVLDSHRNGRDEVFTKIRILGCRYLCRI